MKFRKIVTHPIFIISFSLISSGTFAVFWMIYFTVVLGTYKRLLDKKMLVIFTLIILFAIFEATLETDDPTFSDLFESCVMTLLIITAFIGIFMWFYVPHKLVELRLSAGLNPKISWKIGLIPFIAGFYTAGFFVIHVPTRNLSHDLTMGIGIPMIISCAIAMTYWLYIVHSRFNEYIDKQEDFDQEFRKQRYLRRQKRKKRGKPLWYMTKSKHENNLPPIELSEDSQISTNELDI